MASAVLAGITSYTHAWQIPILGAFLLVWLVGGYYLQRWRLVKAALMSRTKVGLLAAKMNFFGIFVGLAGFGVMCFLAYALNQREFISRYLVGALSIALGIPTLVLLNWVVGMVLLKDVPAGGVLKLTAVNGLAVCVLMAACAAGAGIPANSMRQSENAQGVCRTHMVYVYDALQSFKRSHPNQSITVAELVSKQLIDAQMTRCPAAAGDSGEYVYAPSVSNDKDETRILLCDRQPFHGGVRMVLLDDATRGQPLPKPLSEQEFQNLLAKPANAALAEQLKK